MFKVLLVVTTTFVQSQDLKLSGWVSCGEWACEKAIQEGIARLNFIGVQSAKDVDWLTIKSGDIVTVTGKDAGTYKSQPLLCGYVKNNRDRGFGLFPSSVIRILRDKLNPLGDRRFWIDLQTEKRQPQENQDEPDALPAKVYTRDSNSTSGKDGQQQSTLKASKETQSADNQHDDIQSLKELDKLDILKSTTPLKKTSQIWRWIDDMTDPDFVERLVLTLHDEQAALLLLVSSRMAYQKSQGQPELEMFNSMAREVSSYIEEAHGIGKRRDTKRVPTLSQLTILAHSVVQLLLDPYATELYFENKKVYPPNLQQVHMKYGLIKGENENIVEQDAEKPSDELLINEEASTYTTEDEVPITDTIEKENQINDDPQSDNDNYKPEEQSIDIPKIELDLSEVVENHEMEETIEDIDLGKDMQLDEDYELFNTEESDFQFDSTSHDINNFLDETEEIPVEVEEQKQSSNAEADEGSNEQAEEPGNEETEEPSDAKAEEPSDEKAEEPSDAEAEEPSNEEINEQRNVEVEEQNNPAIEEPNTQKMEEPNNQETEQPNNQETEEPENPETEEPRNQETEENNNEGREESRDGELEETDELKPIVQPLAESADVQKEEISVEKEAGESSELPDSVEDDSKHQHNGSKTEAESTEIDLKEQLDEIIDDTSNENVENKSEENGNQTNGDVEASSQYHTNPEIYRNYNMFFKILIYLSSVLDSWFGRLWPSLLMFSVFTFFLVDHLHTLYSDGAVSEKLNAIECDLLDKKKAQSELDNRQTTSHMELMEAKQSLEDTKTEIHQITESISNLKKWEPEFENYLNGYRHSINECERSSQIFENDIQQLDYEITNCHNKQKSLDTEKFHDIQAISDIEGRRNERYDALQEFKHEMQLLKAEKQTFEIDVKKQMLVSANYQDRVTQCTNGFMIVEQSALEAQRKCLNAEEKEIEIRNQLFELKTIYQWLEANTNFSGESAEEIILNQQEFLLESVRTVPTLTYEKDKCMEQVIAIEEDIFKLKKKFTLQEEKIKRLNPNQEDNEHKELKESVEKLEAELEITHDYYAKREIEISMKLGTEASLRKQSEDASGKQRKNENYLNEQVEKLKEQVQLLEKKWEQADIQHLSTISVSEERKSRNQMSIIENESKHTKLVQKLRQLRVETSDTDDLVEQAEEYLAELTQKQS